MGFLEQKERLAGFDSTSVLDHAAACFADFERSLAGGHGRLELERAIKTVLDIVEGDFDDATKDRARALPLMYRAALIDRIAWALACGDAQPETYAYLVGLAALFERIDGNEDGTFAALRCRLAVALARAAFVALSDDDRARVLQAFCPGESGV